MKIFTFFLYVTQSLCSEVSLLSAHLKKKTLIDVWISDILLLYTTSHIYIFSMYTRLKCKAWCVYIVDLLTDAKRNCERWHILSGGQIRSAEFYLEISPPNSPPNPRQKYPRRGQVKFALEKGLTLSPPALLATVSMQE
jgi:hypothetical protein